MIDAQGFRANVGIILSNQSGQVFWAKRIGQQSWQFPQGGIHAGENAQQALFRELEEEVLGHRPGPRVPSGVVVIVLPDRTFSLPTC